MEVLQKIRKKFDQETGKRKMLKQQMANSRQKVIELKERVEHLEQAREIIREVGLQTQKSLQYHISDITSLALEAVFDDPYELKVAFEHRRNKMECDLLFVRDGNEIDPLESSGYGAADVAAFALRIASWSLQQPRTRNTIILDEPFKHLSEDRQPYASQMLKEVSERLGIQFIIVTHEDTLAQYADKVFHVSIKNKKSKVV